MGYMLSESLAKALLRMTPPCESRLRFLEENDSTEEFWWARGEQLIKNHIFIRILSMKMRMWLNEKQWGSARKSIITLLPDIEKGWQEEILSLQFIESF